jgi:hypothetical protein
VADFSAKMRFERVVCFVFTLQRRKPLSRASGVIMNWRTMRMAELWAMKSTEPSRIIALFRHYAGLSETCPLPGGYGLERMMETIIDHEERERRSDETDGENRDGAQDSACGPA